MANTNTNINANFGNSFPPMQLQALDGSSPQNAAFNSFMQNQKETANLSKLAGGKKRRYKYKYRGGVNSVVIPQAPVAYKDVSIPSINGPGGVLANLISTANQNAANSVYDNYAAKGGTRKRKTKRFLTWGCYSGGKKKSKQTKKHRKHKK